MKRLYAQPRGRTLRSLIGTSGVNGAALFLGLITGVLTARGLEPSERGLLIAIVTWAGLSATLALVGLDEALIYGARGDGATARGLRRVLFRPALVQAVIGTAALAAVCTWLIRPTGAEEWGLVCLVACNVPLNTITLLALAVLRAEDRLSVWNMIRIVPNLVYAATVIILVVSGRLSVALGVTGLIAGGAVAAVAACLAIAHDGVHHVEEREKRQVKRFGRRLTVALLPSLLNPRMDQFAMSVALAPALLGVYTVATAIGSILLAVGASLEQVLFPRLVASQVSRRRLIRWWAGAILVTAFAALLLWALAPLLVARLYGTNYTDALEPLPLILVAACIRAGTGVLSASAKAHNQLTALTTANVAGLAVGLAGFVALMSYGMRGVATAAVMGAVTTAAILVWSTQRGREE